MSPNQIKVHNFLNLHSEEILSLRGIITEKRFLEALGLTKQEDDKPNLDCIIDGVNTEIKCLQKDTWLKLQHIRSMKKSSSNGLDLTLFIVYDQEKGISKILMPTNQELVHQLERTDPGHYNDNIYESIRSLILSGATQLQDTVPCKFNQHLSKLNVMWRPKWSKDLILDKEIIAKYNSRKKFAAKLKVIKSSYDSYGFEKNHVLEHGLWFTTQVESVKNIGASSDETTRND